jgi:hypothetical protein
MNPSTSSRCRRTQRTSACRSRRLAAIAGRRRSSTRWRRRSSSRGGSPSPTGNGSARVTAFSTRTPPAATSTAPVGRRGLGSWRRRSAPVTATTHSLRSRSAAAATSGWACGSTTTWTMPVWSRMSRNRMPPRLRARSTQPHTRTSQPTSASVRAPQAWEREGQVRPGSTTEGPPATSSSSASAAALGARGRGGGAAAAAAAAKRRSGPPRRGRPGWAVGREEARTMGRLGAAQRVSRVRPPCRRPCWTIRASDMERGSHRAHILPRAHTLCEADVMRFCDAERIGFIHASTPIRCRGRHSTDTRLGSLQMDIFLSF